MTKQEQIEEMAKVICGSKLSCEVCLEKAIKDAEICGIDFVEEMRAGVCDPKQSAEALYNAGYRKINDLKAENKQLKTECALLDDELRIARQDTIDVLNELKTKAFDKDAFNGWAGSTFVVLVRDIDKMIEELTKCRR